MYVPARCVSCQTCCLTIPCDTALASTYSSSGLHALLTWSMREQYALHCVPSLSHVCQATGSLQCRMELKLSMDIKTLRGPLCVWLPPPPGDRMWFSFMEPPQLQVTASPLVTLSLPCHKLLSQPCPPLSVYDCVASQAYRRQQHPLSARLH